MAYEIRNKVAVIGTGWASIQRRSDRPLGSLVIEACSNAIADAGLTWSDVDGIATYPSTAGSGVGTEGIDAVGVEYLAQTMQLRDLRWYTSLDRGTIGAVVSTTINAVAAGLCDYAVVWKAMHTPPVPYGTFRTEFGRGETQFRAPYGVGGPYNAGGSAVPEFAFPYSQYLARYDRDRSEMKHHIVANRGHAARNPDAIFYERPITEQDYLTDLMVSDPLSKLDCDMPVDGGGALVITRAELARDRPNRPAYVMGQSVGGIHFRRAPVMLWDDLADNAGSMVGQALTNARIDVGEVEALSCYDGFSYFVPLWIEALGLCGPGEAFDYLRERTGIGPGRMPINTFGGNLGMGRLHGMPQLIEAVRQVQGTAHAGCPEVDVGFANVGSASHGGAAFVFGAAA